MCAIVMQVLADMGYHYSHVLMCKDFWKTKTKYFVVADLKHDLQYKIMLIRLNICEEYFPRHCFTLYGLTGLRNDPRRKPTNRGFRKKHLYYIQ